MAVASRLRADQTWSRVEDWLAAPAAWVPAPTDRHAAVLGSLIRRYHLSANAIPDAHLAALAIEYGVAICSADTDFARFTELRWINPLRPRRHPVASLSTDVAIPLHEVIGQ